MGETLRFPVLGIAPATGKYAKPGEEVLHPFFTQGEFSEAQASVLRQGDRNGMLVIDRDLRCWKVERVIDLGRSKATFLQNVIGSIFGTHFHDVDYDLKALDPMTVAQLRDGVERAIRGNPGEWCFDEDDLNNLSSEGRKLIDDLVARVQAAPNLQQVMEVLATAYDDEPEDGDND